MSCLAATQLCYYCYCYTCFLLRKPCFWEPGASGEARGGSKKQVFSPITGRDELVLLWVKTSVLLSIFPYNRL